MVLKKLLASFAAAVLIASASFEVLAQCGESSCEFIDGVFTCWVIDADGNKRGCTQDYPCSVTCL